MIKNCLVMSKWTFAYQMSPTSTKSPLTVALDHRHMAILNVVGTAAMRRSFILMLNVSAAAKVRDFAQPLSLNHRHAVEEDATLTNVNLGPQICVRCKKR